EAGVDLRGGRLVGERLAGHHMAPVTGGIADRDHQRHIAPARFLERLGAPRPPVDGILGVRAQIGAESVGEPVRHATHRTPGRRREDGAGQKAASARGSFTAAYPTSGRARSAARLIRDCSAGAATSYPAKSVLLAYTPMGRVSAWKNANSGRS